MKSPWSFAGRSGAKSCRWTYLLIGALLTRSDAATVDKYGNVHITQQDMGDASYSQFRRDAANWQSRLNAGNGIEDMRARLERERGEKAAADARREALWRRNVEAAQRNDAYIAASRAESKAKEEAAIAARAKAMAELDEKIRKEQRRIPAVILRAVQAGTDVQADRAVNHGVVAGLAEAFITGSFRGQSLQELGIDRSPRERFDMALTLYRKAAGSYGHKENHSLPSGYGRQAFATDLIGPAAYLMSGRGDEAVRRTFEQSYIEEAWLEILAGLTCALAMPKSELAPGQREQAVSLAAGLIARLRNTQGHDGAALACLVVAAAQRSPELLRVPGLHDQFVPLVRASVWAEGFKSLPAPSADGTPFLGSQIAIPYWNLAALIVLADGTRSPLSWFGRIRRARRDGHVPPISAADKVTLQWVLDGWFDRSGVSPGVRRAIQADCDLACAASEAVLAGSREWDSEMYGIFVESDARSLAALHNPAFVAPLSAQAFLAASPKLKGLIQTYLREACAPSAEQATRVLTALRRVTDLDDALEFPVIARGQWEELVKLGEGFVVAGDKAWLEPGVSARLARLRRERLGDEAGAGRWLAEPSHQPGDRDAPEKWREWATLAGRPGIKIAAQRHPGHWAEPALLRRALNGMAGDVFDRLNSTARLTVKGLLAHAENITDPETVLAIAQVRGPVLGDWAKLGAWLNDPRRRPKDKNDPLHPLFVIAIIERDQAAGHLADTWFTSSKHAVACERLEKWLGQVLAARGPERKKLTEDNFPAVIYCEDAASAYPDLRMLGYDAARGGFASRALLLLSTAEFNPENKIIAGYVTIDGDDGKPERIGGYDVEPWLAAVAKLPRSVPAEVLLSQLTAGVQARLDWQAKVEALPRREVLPGLSKEENDKLNAGESPAAKARSEEERRSDWVGGGCQQALARLAERWSPVRESAQAAILARGDQLLLDRNDLLVHAPGIAARVRWEQSKMRGLDDAEAFAAASAGLTGKDLQIVAKQAGGEGWLRPLVLWQDEGFVSEAKAAAAVAAR